MRVRGDKPLVDLRMLFFHFNVSHCHFYSFLALLCSGVSHSVMLDMHTIQQDNPIGAKTTKGRRFIDEDDDEGSFSSRSDKVDVNNITVCLFFLLSETETGITVKL